MKFQKEIFASFSKDTIRVYQAYNRAVAEEAVRMQNFGDNFSRKRMTWIKPSFLWMMYRSNWGTKKDQEYILGLDIKREYFDSLLERAVLTSPDSPVLTGAAWEKAFAETDVYCQWDPDRSISGSAIERYAIQIGIKEKAVDDLLSGAIVRIEDMTSSVRKFNEHRKCGKLSAKDIPTEKIYPIENAGVRRRLGM